MPEIAPLLLDPAPIDERLPRVLEQDPPDRSNLRLSPDPRHASRSMERRILQQGVPLTGRKAQIYIYGQNLPQYSLMV